MLVTAIIAAGGRGARFGGAQPKQLLMLNGQSLLERSIGAFAAHPLVTGLVVALPPELIDEPPAYLRSAEAFALHIGPPAGASTKPMRLVAGGARRQDSVANAFRAAPAASDLIVIHDAARPLVSADLIGRTIAAAASHGAALAAVQARDTVKRVERGGAAEAAPYVVRETLPRDAIFLAQTPQAFRRDVLEAALAIAERDAIDATDEAALAERAGYRVQIVEGDASNIKITTPEDLVLAEAIVASTHPVRTGRAGTGYDLHRLVEGRPLVIGGITIPHDRGPLGHSDGDVACHAAIDAMLGALALGDIGRHFPDTDPQWKDASSLDLLSRASAMVRAHDYAVGNVDITVILERPKLKEHIPAMRAAMAGAIGVDVERVSIKGKTNEGVDAVGRGEAVAAHAVALLRRR